MGFWWLSWVKVVYLGSVLSLWMSTGMTREEFTGSFYPLSSVVLFAHAYCWILCELLALKMWIWFLTQFTQNWGVPRGPDRNGAGRENDTVQSSAFKCQWSCVLWEKMSLWNQMEGCSSALPARWQPQKSTAGLWNRGWISLSPARFCCSWALSQVFALSCAMRTSLE